MKSLLESLRDLARPGEEQLAIQPAGAHKPDEIALDFDDALKYWKPRLWTSLSSAQREALSDVDARLSIMSGSANSQLWSEEAVLSDPAWTELRQLARRAAALLEGGT